MVHMEKGYNRHYQCTHSWVTIKSDTDLLQWSCGSCHSGSHWVIMRCTFCGSSAVDVVGKNERVWLSAKVALIVSLLV